MGVSAIKRAVVLIVEDDFLIRMDAIEMIETAGFDTLEAADADQAIAILQRGPTFTSSSPTSRCRVL